MRTIDEQLARIRERSTLGVMTHVVAGYPSLGATERLVRGMERVGADFVEMQIPFSDPIADGPVIMEANDTALKGGVTTNDCFALAAKLSRTLSIPLLFMCYYHTIFVAGVDSFCRRARKAGIQGLIVPDLPPDEEKHERFLAACRRYGLPVIRVVSPSSTDERLALNARYEDGFVYCTARAGTTGSASALGTGFVAYMKRVRRHMRVPLAVGFGISTPQQVRAIRGIADMAVIGSALTAVIKSRGVPAALELTRTLTAAAKTN